MSQELSQEEIQKRMQLMKDNCIFCKIIKKEDIGITKNKDDTSTPISYLNLR